MRQIIDYSTEIQGFQECSLTSEIQIKIKKGLLLVDLDLRSNDYDVTYLISSIGPILQDLRA